MIDRSRQNKRENKLLVIEYRIDSKYSYK